MSDINKDTTLDKIIRVVAYVVIGAASIAAFILREMYKTKN